MELTITKEDFAKVIGTPSTQINNLFAKVQPYFVNVQAALEHEICYLIADFPAENMIIADETKRFICLMAYFVAIPSIDLVWTDTGFGVVQNNTLAPASRDRVNALRDSIREQAIATKYHLLDELYKIQAFADAQPKTGFVFLYSQYQQLDGNQLTAVEFDAKVGAFRDGERKLRMLISRAEMERLCGFARHAFVPAFVISDAQKAAIRLISQFCIEHERDFCAATLYLPEILQIINDEANAADFPLYRESDECKANNAEHYENTADKPTFFFC